MALLLETEDLHFSYHGFEPCLSGVTMAVNAGERIGLVGHNGAGKSTLLHLLVGLNKPSSGRIAAFGRDYQSEEDFRLLRRRVGLVFQDPDDQLFCPTVAEDVAFGPLNLGYSIQDAMCIVDETLASLGLSEFRERITHKLSGGQKRLVSLATVLAMKPDILLLDEPTNALDEKTTRSLIDILVNLPQAMVIVSHDRAFREEVVTRTILMEGGQIR
ncbi:energy-coupling factor ABC transporter ATP-binding protein [Cohaesibacter celericrescens]|uniref:Energy-coupling factor ABC transporter ATP-binding protein n=1 Tax=Cohaesibacter celericrescens TaxID=2067669 RepID=A0A2N5XW25_9HYPH|nr:ABC transporter ATP-binding protein [Cohaesibacter celericrescens]PLW78628.1 energy-coupling factor ABC transporter ATP-binding protein [Cohaesibacter celericrescens]